MKKIITLIILLVMITANTTCVSKQHIGDIITFGELQWRIIDKKDRNILIISEHIIEQRPYNDIWRDVTWENCSLREYLNNDFFNNQFALEEQARIVDTRNTSHKNPWYDIEEGNQTVDKIFLLSLEEVVKYFGDSRSLEYRKAWEVDLENSTKSNLIFVESPYGYLIRDRFNEARQAIDENGEERSWWLRSPGRNTRDATMVNYTGFVIVAGVTVTLETGGVRPAMWIKNN